MSQIHAKNRIGSSKAYEDYCHIHKLLKGYCCKRSVCKFWDLAYYLERAYQESFSQSLRIYLCDIVELPQAKLANILRPKKTSFLTFNSKTLETLQLDESYEVDENIELVIKSNI